jgi:hypothetical protein
MTLVPYAAEWIFFCSRLLREDFFFFFFFLRRGTSRYVEIRLNIFHVDARSVGTSDSLSFLSFAFPFFLFVNFARGFYFSHCLIFK